MGSRQMVTKRKSTPPSQGEGAARPIVSVETISELSRVRRHFLEALPIAGAVIGVENGAAWLIEGNSAFEALDSLIGSDGEIVPLLDRCGFTDRIVEFCEGGGDILDFEWSDGGPIVGRHYSVRLARLALIAGNGPRCLLTLVDRSAERATEKSLRLEMFNDSLTGLPNRAGFIEWLETARADKAWGEGHYAVMMVDLTRFSRINESIGSLSGDELLITIARRLMSAMRSGDVLARTGGDEFGLFLRVRDAAGEAIAAAERINAVLTAPYRLSDLEIQIGCAIGCAVSEDGCDEDEIVRRAQFATKQAKSSGQVEIYQPRAFNLARHQFAIETALRRAIEADRLRLAFQPLIDLSSGRIAGFEALARWREDGRDIPPSEFIPVAEESGLIVPLGRWAIDRALKTLKLWDLAEGRSAVPHIAVNISAIQVARDDVAGAVREALNAHKLAGTRLTLELTESAIVADPDRAKRAMEALKGLDARLAMDDFGTGYSNLAYLQRLPIDILKIDQSFVTGMLADKDKVAIVRAVLSLAQALGLRTTAEGVETVELAQTLAALGCTSAQGYFYAPPLEPEAAFEFWRSRSS